MNFSQFCKLTLVGSAIGVMNGFICGLFLGAPILMDAFDLVMMFGGAFGVFFSWITMLFVFLYGKLSKKTVHKKGISARSLFSFYAELSLFFFFLNMPLSFVDIMIPGYVFELFTLHDIICTLIYFVIIPSSVVVFIKRNHNTIFEPAKS